jgi:hypothetical protein
MGRHARDLGQRLPAMTEPVTIAEDRSIAVPPGHVIRTGYVPVHKIRLACRDRMAVGDVDRAYQRQLQLGDKQRWPCPRGDWKGKNFILVDGRHAYVSALMLGFEQLLVAWVEPG